MIETERLILRGWQEADVAPFHAICSDPRVMATLGPPLSHAQTADLVARMQARQARERRIVGEGDRMDAER